MITYLGRSGEVSVTDYGNDQNKLWKVESNCNNTRIISTLFDIAEGFDFVTIDGAIYSGLTVLDLMLPNTSFVGFSSASHGFYPGFVLAWQCHQQGDLKDLKSSFL